MKRCGELGLLGTDVPEEYGGVALDKVSSVVVGEGSASPPRSRRRSARRPASRSRRSSASARGPEAEVPATLVTGEIVGAYALTESGSGSDALGAKARAVRQPDGSFVLNGEKMWITNGGFADLFIVFAKVDGEQFTAFIVERRFPGVSSGKEEHKMGPARLVDDAAHPAGRAGARRRTCSARSARGTRSRSTSSTTAGSSWARCAAAARGGRRRSGALRRPAEAVRAADRELRRDQAQARRDGRARVRRREHALPHGRADRRDDRRRRRRHEHAARPPALEEFAIEASILKVASSEMLDFVLDENVQIHGGNGFVRDYPAERHYRDARVNRIFEGTNEINRLLIPGMLMRRALKGGLPLIPAGAEAPGGAADAIAGRAPGATAPFDPERRAIAAMKKVALMVLGTAMQTYGEKVADEQEVLSWTADILIGRYAAESALLARVQPARAPKAGDCTPMPRASASTTPRIRVEAAARKALAAMVEGDMLRTLLAALRRVMKVTPVNTVALRRRIVDAVLMRMRIRFKGSVLPGSLAFAGFWFWFAGSAAAARGRLQAEPRSPIAAQPRRIALSKRAVSRR